MLVNRLLPLIILTLSFRICSIAYGQYHVSVKINLSGINKCLVLARGRWLHLSLP